MTQLTMPFTKLELSGQQSEQSRSWLANTEKNKTENMYTLPSPKKHRSCKEVDRKNVALSSFGGGQPLDIFQTQSDALTKQSQVSIQGFLATFW